jgi:hypothetical protein
MTTKIYVVRDRVGLADDRPAPDREPIAATVVRGMLKMTNDGSRQTIDGATLLDATGRKVAVLRSGPNDVGRLPPGVYFVRAAAGPVRRVVVVR